MDRRYEAFWALVPAEARAFAAAQRYGPYSVLDGEVRRAAVGAAVCCPVGAALLKMGKGAGAPLPGAACTALGVLSPTARPWQYRESPVYRAAVEFEWDWDFGKLATADLGAAIGAP